MCACLKQIVLSPDADAHRLVPEERDGGHLLEELQQLHLPELSDVEVGHPEVLSLVPRQLHVAHVRLFADVHSRVLPVDVQEHVQGDLL